MIEKAVKIIQEKHYNIYCVCEYRNGKIQSAQLCPANRLNNIYSLSKNFTATAIGMLADRGALSLQDGIARHLSRYSRAAQDKKFETITLHNLLTHTCGFGRGMLFEADQRTHGTANWAAAALREPTPYRPGEKSVYSNATYYLLSLIVENTVRATLFDFLRTELFLPLAFENFASSACPLGHTQGATGFFLAAQDFVKLGILYLNGGAYEGKRYLSEEFVRTATSPLCTAGERLYGYSFWKNRADGALFYGDGAHGQILAVDPDREIVLAVQGYDDKLSAKYFVSFLFE